MTAKRVASAYRPEARLDLVGMGRTATEAQGEITTALGELAILGQMLERYSPSGPVLERVRSIRDKLTRALRRAELLVLAFEEVNEP